MNRLRPVMTRTAAPLPEAASARADDQAAALAEGLWNADDVAGYLRISRRSVYSLPGLPSVKLPPASATSAVGCRPRCGRG